MRFPSPGHATIPRPGAHLPPPLAILALLAFSAAAWAGLFDVALWAFGLFA